MKRPYPGETRTVCERRSGAETAPSLALLTRARSVSEHTGEHSRTRPTRLDGPERVSTDRSVLILVVLTGIDGAGKSTAARLLRRRVKLDGGRALLLQNYGGRRTISTWCAKLHVQLRPRVADAMETSIRVSHVLVSHLRARRFAGLVLMDRHLHCQLAMRTVRALPRGRLLPWLLRRLPQPDLVVFFDISPPAAQDRIAHRGTDEETLQFLEAFRAAYRALPEFPSFAVVDAGGSTEETTEQLVALLELVAARTS